MLSDHAVGIATLVLTLIDVLILGRILWQGERTVFYERETYLMNRERYEERKKWREQKQRQSLKKAAGEPDENSQASSA